MSFDKIGYLIEKELRLELRQKYALNGILLYVVSTVFISYLSFKQIIQPTTWNALFWIIMLFAAVNAISRSFIQESRGRLLYQYTLVSPQELIVAKTIYNILLMIALGFICLVCYSVFIGNIVQDMSLFILVVILGSSGFASVFTLMSAIASRAGNNFALMAILCFPVIIPFMLALIKVSKNAMDGLAFSVSLNGVLVLAFLNVIVFTLSYLLFPYLWKE